MSEILLIADSGPLIALARLDLLALPSRFFQPIWVTSTIWDEVTRKRLQVEARRLEQAVAIGLIVRVEDPDLTVESLPNELFQRGIDHGERTVIGYALQTQAAVLLDDRRARRIAEQLAVPVLGTLGLLARARASGVIGPLRPLLEALSQSGYFLPHQLIEWLLSDLGE